MKEEKIISKIKELKQVQPREDWVDSTKREIFNEKPKEQVSPFSILFNSVQKPILALGTIALVAFVAGSLFFSSAQNIPGAESLITLDKPKEVGSDSLAGLQNQVKELNSKLKELRKAENPNKALVLSENIKTTAEKGQKVLNEIEPKNDKEAKNLASLFERMKEEAGKEQEEMIEALIKDLKTRNLTVNNQERLQKAENSYNNDNIRQALFYLLRIQK